MMFDTAHFNAMTAGDAGLQREIVDLFRGQLPEWTEKLASKDAQIRKDAAHKIKGSALGIGLPALTAACAAAEADPGDAEAMRQLALALAEALSALQAAYP